MRRGREGRLRGEFGGDGKTCESISRVCVFCGGVQRPRVHGKSQQNVERVGNMESAHAELKVRLKAHMHDDPTVDSALQALFCYKENLSECNLEQIEEEASVHESHRVVEREQRNFER